MDNRVGEIEVFVTATETGNFSAAGRRLGLSPSAVSKVISRLEHRLGTRLIVRSTRAMALTSEGELYLEKARRILDDILELETIVTSGGKVLPRGLLRVNSSLGFGERYLLPLVPRFLERHPEVQLDVSLTDGVIALIEERTDVAIRSGLLDDSSLRARKLLESRRVIVASPAYLRIHGIPQTPAELVNHNCLTFNFRRSLNEWSFRDSRSSDIYRLPVSGDAAVNSGWAMRSLCLSGLGLARIGRFHVEPDIQAGTLIPVLEEYNPDDTEQIHAVFAGHDHLAARVRAFLDFLVEHV